MKRSALLALGTTLLLQASGFAMMRAQREAKNPPAATRAARAGFPAPAPGQRGPGKAALGATDFRSGSGKSGRSMAHPPPSPRRRDPLEVGRWADRLLLASLTLLAAGVLLAGLEQRKLLLSLGKQLADLEGRLAAWERVAGWAIAAAGQAQSPDVSPRPALLPDNPPLESLQAGTPSLVEPPPPRETPPAASPQLASPPRDGEAGSSPAGDAAEAPPLPPHPHHEVATLLARLRHEVPRLAERFADPALRELFRCELDAPLGARLDRLRAVSELGEEQLERRWLVPDLVTTLDALARFYSAAVEEERQGHVTGLSRELRRWLYDSFGPACRGEGWFDIDAVDPYLTEFDPRVHHAVAGRDVDGAQGRIVAIKAIGRRDPRSGAVAHKAAVIVGR